MGIDFISVPLMKKFGISGKGASFAYPHFVNHKERPKTRRRSEPDFRELGVPFPDVYDLGPLEGYDIKYLDLNEPVPEELHGRYDYIINPGTYDVVFNIGQAIANGYLMTKPGGLAFHHGSIGRPNLGYFNMTVNSWKAFCDLNGELLHYQEDGRVYYAVTRRGDGKLQWPKENNVR